MLCSPLAGAIIAVCPATGDGDDGESDTLEGISEEGGSSSEASGGKDNAAAKCAHTERQRELLTAATPYPVMLQEVQHSGQCSCVSGTRIVE